MNGGDGGVDEIPGGLLTEADRHNLCRDLQFTLLVLPLGVLAEGERAAHNIIASAGSHGRKKDMEALDAMRTLWKTDPAAAAKTEP
ncbi:hypothetical protein LCGC14_1557260 [marine sediment metagenome]|uniref:Uncharacterized protein n=1 Tax=marine sediment metagenome TaxID=412755 RepID=A0A0F9INM9_9ZZZZ